MTDPRYTKLAKLLINYSTALKKGDRILLDMIDVPDEFAIELMMGSDTKHAALVRDIEMFRMKRVEAYIAVRGSANATEASDVKSETLAMYSKTLRPLLNYRVNKTRWCVLRWPSPSMAQGAGMSTE